MKRVKARPFAQARKFARSLFLKGQKDWERYSKSGKRPADIPGNPGRTYKEEWNGWGDWLGTGNVARGKMEFCSFNEARKYARKLGLKKRDDWNAHNLLRFKRHNRKTRMDVPRDPRDVYKNEWKGWGDFLGTGNIAPIDKKYRSFAQARKFVQKLKLKSRTKWEKHCKSGELPDDIPKHPEDTYKNKGWKGVSDWLGTNYIPNKERKYLTGKEAKILARKVKKEIFGDKVITMKDWAAAYKAGKIPKELPSSIHHVYGGKK